MCRRSSPSFRLVILLAVGSMLAGVPATRGDDLDAFLARHGLDELLALHLESKLETASAAEREPLLTRLATIYAGLLESVDDPARLAVIEEQSRVIIGAAPPTSADRLRLALLRGSYRNAERIAENHRLRLATPEELDLARATLSDIIPKLQGLRRQLDDRISDTERRLSRAAGSTAVVLGEEADRLREIDAQATFLAGWALYYQAWLNDRPESARVAQELFAELIGASSAHQDPENVSVDRRRFEAFSRSILGLALCKSMTAQSSTAIQWLALLEHPETFEGLRVQVPAWTLVVHLQQDEFVQAARYLDDLAGRGETISVTWLRLCAVRALEAAGTVRYAEDLARVVVTELGARGELEQVLDLANRYGIESLGDTGFALLYVRGVLAYHEARAGHDPDFPTVDDELVALYGRAYDDFVAALSAPDAARYPAAAGDARRLIAWCEYSRGRFLPARDAFIAAEAAASADEGPELLWMAIVSLDKVVRARSDPALAAELAALTERFVTTYPHSRHAPKLVLRQALASGADSLETVETLLAIPENSEVHVPARRQAAQMLYRLFRDAKDVGVRARHGDRYLDVALPLFGASDPSDPTAPLGLAEHLVRGRRILEVALTDGVERLVAARRILEDFARLRDDGTPELDALADEIDYRTLRLHLLGGDDEAAERIADALWERADRSIWARLGARAIFRTAVKRWRAARSSRADEGRVVRHGTRILEEFPADASGLADPAVLSYTATVAEAAFSIWRRGGDPARGAQALDLYRRLLEVRPRNAAFLRAGALLASDAGDVETALDWWRRLLSGTAEESAAWFEAKYHLIALLARTDPGRARDVMDQHRLLHPEYGPDPWGERLRELERTLPAITNDDDDEEVPS